MKLINSDCIIAMKEMPDNSVDSIVTDPPYGLEFMGKEWDAPWKNAEVVSTTSKSANGIFHDKGFDSGIRYSRGHTEMREFQKWCELWAIEALRVLKPGGHLIAFSGSRTYHRMAVAVEDAGFEIRDQIMWVYGSGFPKSMDISKAIDKAAGVERTEVLGTRSRNVKPFDDLNGWNENNTTGDYDYKAPATPEAQQWQGWGTALKPAHEPMVLARKPIVGTVANNVLTYGVGGLNIDGARVLVDEKELSELNRGNKRPTGNGYTENTAFKIACVDRDTKSVAGRFPANFIHDGSDEVVELFPNAGKGNNGKPFNYSGTEYNNKDTSLFNGDKPEAPSNYNDSGSASRFFYCAKTSKRDRNEGLEGFEEKQVTGGGGLTANLREDGSLETASAGGEYGSIKAKQTNTHPTVKPTALMQYLVRLVTPPCGTVLDPFMGSGSTGKAAVLEGFDFIGIDQSAEYVDIARARIEFALREEDEKEEEKEYELPF